MFYLILQINNFIYKYLTPVSACNNDNFSFGFSHMDWICNFSPACHWQGILLYGPKHQQRGFRHGRTLGARLCDSRSNLGLLRHSTSRVTTGSIFSLALLCARNKYCTTSINTGRHQLPQCGINVAQSPELRLAEVKALNVGNANVSQAAVLFVSLNALCNHLNIQQRTYVED